MPDDALTGGRDPSAGTAPTGDDLVQDSLMTRVPSGSPDPDPGPGQSPSDPGSIAGPAGVVDLYATVAPGFDASALAGASPPELFPGYELIEPVGEGGMGEVWKARQVKLNRLVAFKMVLGGHRAGPKEMIRFLAEAEAVAAIHHPHVVQVYEYGESAGRPYLAMEFLRGGSLADRLKANPRLDPRAAAALVRSLAEAVQAAHDQGIVHRDLKPANVLFDSSGQPKVTDFGLAKRAGGNNMTATQAVMGTPSYMAPEQARGDTKFVGPQADIYSLGVILYEALTGIRPFQDESQVGLLRKVIEDEPSRPKTHIRGLPRDIELICLKCLEKDPARRYQTALALAADLRRFRDGESILARPVGGLERAWRWYRRYPAIAGLLSAVALSLIAGLVGILHFAFEAEANARDARRYADQAESQARKALDNAEHLRYSLIRQQVGSGTRSIEDGDRARGLWLYAHAWELDAGNPASEDSHRLRLGFALEAGPQLVGIRFHARPVLDAVFDPAGQRVLTRTDEPRAYLWDPSADHLAGPPLEHDGEVLAGVFHPAGDQLATGSADGRLRFWDAGSGALIRALPQGGAVNSLAYRPDGGLIAAATQAGTVRFLDPRTGEPAPSALELGAAAYHVAFSPDGRRVVTADAGHVARVWDVATGQAVTAPLPHQDHRSEDETAIAYRCWPAFSPDGSALATVHPNRKTAAEVTLWDLASGKPRVPPLKLGYFVRQVHFLRDGARLLVNCGDAAKLYDSATGELFGSMPHPRETPHASFRPDEKLLATCSTGGPIHLWDPATLKEVDQPLRCADGVHSLCFSPDGRLLLASSHDGTARVWRLQNPGQVCPYDFDCGRAELVGRRVDDEVASFSADGRREVRYSGPKGVRVRSRGGQGPDLPIVHAERVIVAEFSPDGGRLMTQDARWTLRWWDATTGLEAAPSLALEARLLDFGMSRDGRRLLTVEQGLGVAGRAVTVWDVDSGRALIGPLRIWDTGPQRFGERRLSDQISKAALSPDGTRLALGSDATGTLGVRDVDSGRELARTFGYRGVLYQIDFSADGERFLTNGSDTVARIWRAATCEPAGPPLRHPRFCRQADLARDGWRVATVVGDKVLRLWDGRNGDLLGRIELQVADLTTWFSLDGRRLVINGGRQTLDLPHHGGDLAGLPDLLRLLTGLQRDPDDSIGPVDPQTFLRDPESFGRAWGAWRGRKE